ncbi:uncharacterized protein AAEQ78_015495 isoform 2-T2 [Lycaon pictus]
MARPGFREVEGGPSLALLGKENRKKKKKKKPQPPERTGVEEEWRKSQCLVSRARRKESAKTPPARQAGPLGRAKPDSRPSGWSSATSEGACFPPSVGGHLSSGCLRIWRYQCHNTRFKILFIYS